MIKNIMVSKADLRDTICEELSRSQEAREIDDLRTCMARMEKETRDRTNCLIKTLLCQEYGT
jgi:hypothetical protein